VRRLAAVLGLLTTFGCKTSEPPPPATPGVSMALQYPVLLIGQGSLDVRDSAAALTSIRGASSLNLNERVILDSAGRLFTVTRAEPIAGQGSVMWDMGTSQRLYAVTVAPRDDAQWRDVQDLVVAEVKKPTSLWAGDQRAVRRVQALPDARSLIEACRDTGAWTRE
jgi:hypothetical protein